MAGLYPDVPGHRMAYDRDGSVVFRFNFATSGGHSVFTAGERATINDEDSDTANVYSSGSSGWEHFAFGILFPELRNVQGIRMYGTGFGVTDLSANSSAQWSPNTSNGIDGTWTDCAGFTDVTVGFSVTGLRTGISVLALTGVRGIRIKRRAQGTFGASSWDISTLHVYGSAATGENPDRLRFWQSAVDAEIAPAYFDLGDIARGTTQTRAFRIKNNSATLTAQSVAISTEALTDTVPTNISQHEFSTDNITFFPSINIGNLAPGAISSVLYMRRVTSPSATLSLWWTRFIASASVWV